MYFKIFYLSTYQWRAVTTEAGHAIGSLFTELIVLVKKFWGGNKVLPKLCDICPNHYFLVLYR